MELADLVQQVEGFDKLPPREKIRVFAWWLHTYRTKEAFNNADIRACYDQLHMSQPNVAMYLIRMAEYKPPDVVTVKGGYKLERSVRSVLDAKYGIHHSVVQVSKLLSDTRLSGKELSR
jgi:hypothetical protein